MVIQPHALTASGCQPTDAADGCRGDNSHVNFRRSAYS